MSDEGDQRSLVTIHADGACRGNPGPGGWGAVLRWGEHEKEIWGGEAETTNNRMELTAAIRALEALRRPCSVHLHTDSQYVQKGISQWIRKWKDNGWQTVDKQPVKNIDLWQQLDQLTGTHRVAWVWVRGHAGDVDNERVDRLANRGIDDLRVAGSGRSR